MEHKGTIRIETDWDKKERDRCVKKYYRQFGNFR